MEDGLLIKLAIGALVPGAIGAGVLGAAWWRHRATTAEKSANSQDGSLVENRGEPYWIVPAIVAGLATIMIPILTESRTWPPRGAVEWLPLAALLAGVTELATGFSRIPAFLRWSIRLGLLVLIAAACARTMVEREGERVEAIAWIVGFAIVTLAATTVMERLLARTRGFTAPALLLILVGGGSQILAVGYSSLKLGQAVGVVAAVLGAACAVSLIRPRFSLAFGGAFTIVTILATGVLAGNMSAETRIGTYTTVIALSALLPGLMLVVPTLRGLTGMKRSLALFTLAGIPIAVALALVAKDEISRKKSGYDEYSLVTEKSPTADRPLAQITDQ